MIPLIIILAVLLVCFSVLIYYEKVVNPKEFNKRISQICALLQERDINASVIPVGYLDKLDRNVKGKESYHLNAICEIRGHLIDYIFYVTETSQRTQHDYLEYAVVGSIPELETREIEFASSSPSVFGRASKWIRDQFYTHTVRLVEKKDKSWRGNVVDIDWEGEPSLAQSLASDSEIKGKILQGIPNRKALKQVIISYGPKTGYAEIRTPFDMKEIEDVADDFIIMEMIAGHIKSAWFGQ